MPPTQRGAAYGLRQALDAVGAVLGPLAAMVLMSWWASDVRAVLWFAVAPAALAVALLVAGVREPAEAAASSRGPVTPSLRDAMAMPRAFWAVVGLGVVFTLARFSEAFLVLRADDVGLPPARVPLVMAAMSATFAAGAFPAGRAADRLGARGLLWCGLATLVAADLRLATATTPLHVVAGAGGWGLHLALTQGLFSKLVADAGPAGLRGTAFGVFNLATGVALLAASAIAGALWAMAGPSATFYTGAALAALTAVGLAIYRPGER